MDWTAVGTIGGLVVTFALGAWGLVRSGRGQKAEEKAEDATNVVAGFSQLMTAMQAELTRLGEAVDRCEAREIECREREDRQRATIRQLRRELADATGGS